MTSPRCQMSSFFSTGLSRRNGPAWCKKGMFVGIPPTINQRPATASAYARWTGIDSGGSYNVIETFRLRRNATDTGWVGESSNSGNNVKLEILDTADLTIVDVLLNVRIDTAVMNSHLWPAEPTTARPPWGTSVLNYSDGHAITLAEVQVLA